MIIEWFISFWLNKEILRHILLSRIFITLSSVVGNLISNSKTFRYVRLSIPLQNGGGKLSYFTNTTTYYIYIYIYKCQQIKAESQSLVKK